MSGKRKRALNLTEQLELRLSEFSAKVKEQVVSEIRKVSKEAANTLRDTSPRNMGNYAQGWRVNQIGTLDRKMTRAVVYNGPDYQLTHLLEKGHATRNGGRTRAQPHIKTVEDKIKKELPARIEQKIKGG